MCCGGGRYEPGVAGAGAAEPVLAAAELSGLLVGATPAREQFFVHLAQQAVRDGEAFAQPGHAMLEGGDVVRDLHDVVERHAEGLVELEEQEVRKRRLGALDLAGEHRLAPDVGVEEQVGVGQQGGYAVQPPAGEQGPLQQTLTRAGEIQRRVWRQRRGHEGAHPLAARHGSLVSPSSPTPHRYPHPCE